MNSTVSPLRNHWEPMPDQLGEAQQRLADVLESWRGTPFRRGMATKGKGAFCTSFVCRVLDELMGRDYLAVPDIPTDIGEHNRQEAIRNARFFRRRYPLHDILPGTATLQPGDIMVVGREGPGHAMIVGPRCRTIWQCEGSAGVHYTGWGLARGRRLFTVYRLLGRDKWA